MAALGDGVSRLSVGDPVFGVAGFPNGGSGGFAEFAVTGADCLARPPAIIDMATAGTLGWVGQVALHAMESLGVQSGTRLLVHGASGGVGQLALDGVRELVEQGVLKPHVVDFFPVEEITSAFRRKEGGGVYGKIGVTIR